MKMNWIKQTLAALLCIFFMVSCEYEFIEAPAPPTPPDPEDTISFVAEIAPIFENSSCTNCHNGGSLALNLTPSNAYSSIVSNNLVVPFDAEASKIYYFPHPVNGTHHTRYASTDDADKIYGWILQGALDN